MNKVKALVTSSRKYKIVQHFRNGINWGDSWWFITKMAIQGHLLTDEKYEKHIQDLFSRFEEPSTPYDSALLGEQQ
jgi:hypothetical protein